MTEKLIVLVNPNHPGNCAQSALGRENIGLGYLSSGLIDQGFTSKILDSRLANQTPQDAINAILELNPIIAGFSVYAKDASRWTELVAEAVKRENRGIHVSVGSYFPTLQPIRAFQSMPSVDSIVIREGDRTFPELVSRIGDGKEWRNIRGIAYKSADSVQINPHRELVNNLDSLPFPEHYASMFGLDEFAIEGSRGCYCACTFCSIIPFFSAGEPQERWRYRSASSIVDEIKTVNQAYPEPRLFRFVDPEFVGAPRHEDRLRDFLKELKRNQLDIEFIITTRTKSVLGTPEDVWKDLQRVGLKEVYLGVETASPHIKKMMQKGTTIEEDKRAISLLNNLNIKTRFGFMMITPWTTEDDIEFNARMLRSLGFARLDKYFQEMFLVPGTKSVELAKRTTDIWYDGNDRQGEYYTYDLPHPIDNLRRMTRTVMMKHDEFMDKVLALHDTIRKSELFSTSDMSAQKEKLGNFCLDFFLRIFDGAEKLKPELTEEEIDKYIDNLIHEYEIKLENMEIIM